MPDDKKKKSTGVIGLFEGIFRDEEPSEKQGSEPMATPTPQPAVKRPGRSTEDEDMQMLRRMGQGKR